ncbi:hypothetical protein [Marinobacter sp. NFXS9]|uniref:hypothetical protein n=1 Tax=Marinobacter sp. NFXS9 TaxID=2818433 RepID=UPI0032DF2B49
MNRQRPVNCWLSENGVFAGATKYCSLSGPCKGNSFIELGIRSGALIAIDSFDELITTKRLASSIKKNANLMLRWNGGQQDTRYGMPFSEMEKCINLLVEDEALQLEGFSFHLSDYLPESRAACLSTLLELSHRLKSKGINIRKINIGGGMPICYIGKEAWDNYHRNIREDHFYKKRMPSSYYPYWNSVSRQSFIDGILLEHSNALRLQSLDIELMLEPGRALVDNAGFSVFKVLGLKTSEAGNHCIIVQGLSFSACEVWCNSEFLVDPTLIPMQNSECSTPIKAYIAGQSCLEDDLITNRFVSFNTVPERGDLLVFNNTAGYQMDLMESKFHLIPPPQKITLQKTEANTSWTFD